MQAKYAQPPRGLMATGGSKESLAYESCENSSQHTGTNQLPKKTKKHRRMASQINKEYKCLYCKKCYGSIAAMVMHMRKKHNEGTKQELERKFGMKLHDILRAHSGNSELSDASHGSSDHVTHLPQSRTTLRDMDRATAMAQLAAT